MLTQCSPRTIIISHPFAGSPSLPFDTVNNPPKPAEKEDIRTSLANLPEPRKSYRGYYSSAPAAADMDNPKESLHDFLRAYFHLKSADWKCNNPHALKAWEASELAKMPYYYVMPLHSGMRESVKLCMKDESLSTATKLGSRWLLDADLAVYVDEFGRTGFQGGLNWYRVTTSQQCMKDVELFAGKKIEVPLLYMAGKKDWGTYQEPGAVDNMGKHCTKLKGVELLDDAGHWVQQEQPEKVAELVAKFLKDVRVNSMSY